MKKHILPILLGCVLPLSVSAQDLLIEHLDDLSALGGNPTQEAKDTNYIRIRMADSCYIEVYNYGDSILLTQTICAPICSSIARVYTQEMKLIREIPSPQGWIFPIASIEKGQLIWHDNTMEMLDDSENKQ